MPEKECDLHQQLDRLQEKLPRSAAKAFRTLRHPSWKWARLPAAFLLIVGGFLAFLPVLGLWMVPLGVALLALDVPFLRKPTARLIGWCLDKWEARRGAHQRG